MSHNEIAIGARPDAVFAVLSDGEAYASWVVGAKEIRTADPEWPEPGARIHHTIGAGPAELRDESEVVAVERNRRLVLEARFRPVGVARVVLELRPDDSGGTVVGMAEEPVSGPARALWSPAFGAAAHLRNWLALRRLRRLVERRGRGVGGLE